MYNGLTVPHPHRQGGFVPVPIRAAMPFGAFGAPAVRLVRPVDPCAGAAGTALSFCSYEERGQLNSIERLIRKPVATVEDHPFRSPIGRMKPKTSGYISVPKRRGRARGRRR